MAKNALLDTVSHNDAVKSSGEFSSKTPNKFDFLTKFSKLHFNHDYGIFSKCCFFEKCFFFSKMNKFTVLIDF